jgi:hypothetical protein
LIGNLIANVEQQTQAEFNDGAAPPSDYNPEDFEIQDEEESDDEFTEAREPTTARMMKIYEQRFQIHTAVTKEDEALQALFNE